MTTTSALAGSASLDWKPASGLPERNQYGTSLTGTGDFGRFAVARRVFTVRGASCGQRRVIAMPHGVSGAPLPVRYWPNQPRMYATFAIMWLGIAEISCDAFGTRTIAVGTFRNFSAS